MGRMYQIRQMDLKYIQKADKMSSRIFVIVRKAKYCTEVAVSFAIRLGET